MTIYAKYQLIVDAWRFWQDHLDPEDADDWWDRLVRDGEAFVMDHDQSYAARKLIVAIMQIIEEDYKRGKGINSTEGEKTAGGDRHHSDP